MDTKWYQRGIRWLRASRPAGVLGVPGSPGQREPGGAGGLGGCSGHYPSGPQVPVIIDADGLWLVNKVQPFDPSSPSSANPPRPLCAQSTMCLSPLALSHVVTGVARPRACLCDPVLTEQRPGPGPQAALRRGLQHPKLAQITPLSRFLPCPGARWHMKGFRAPGLSSRQPKIRPETLVSRGETPKYLSRQRPTLSQGSIRSAVIISLDRVARTVG